MTSQLSKYWARGAVAIALALAVVGQRAATARAEDGDKPGETADSKEVQLPDIGVRMTPAIMSAMTYRFSEMMRTQLDLDDKQRVDVEQIMQTHMAKLVNNNAEIGREAIEMMMATMIRNDGRFPKEDAVKFAKLIKPLMPGLREYFTNTSTEIGQKLNFKQRLEFGTQMGVVMGGLSMFEKRMDRWEEGKVSDNANPFWDPGDRDPDAAETPADPNEHPDHRRARLEVERWTSWELRIDDGWDEYLKRASDHYEFDETQKTSGENVLKQCKERAAAIKSPEWHEKIKKNRIARRLTRRANDIIGDGPVGFNLERDYNKLRQPLLDLDEEFKRRIDELPTSKQREAAKQKARKFLVEHGMEQPPV